MARAFTVNFFYKDKTYTAVISQLDGSMSIYVPDETLHSILPHGKFTFKTQQGIRVDTPQLLPAQDLVVTILGVIEERFNEVPKEK